MAFHDIVAFAINYVFTTHLHGGLLVVFRSTAVWFGAAFRFWLGFRAVFETGRVPAAAFQMKAGGGHHFAQAGFTAFGTVRQLRVAHLLQIFLLEPAGCAAVLVDRHNYPMNQKLDLEPD